MNSNKDHNHGKFKILYIWTNLIIIIIIIVGVYGICLFINSFFNWIILIKNSMYIIYFTIKYIMYVYFHHCPQIKGKVTSVGRKINNYEFQISLKLWKGIKIKIKWKVSTLMIAKVVQRTNHHSPFSHKPKTMKS